ncbi:MAG: MBL fold metallo-hydrolase [Gammaproteobacteria bacterium]
METTCSLRFASIGSGSKGNCTVVSKNGTSLLVDNGFSLKETLRRLTALGVIPETLKGIIVTHEHSDHIRGVGVLARKLGLSVWSTAGTAFQLQDEQIPDLRLFNGHEPFTVDDILISPYPVPHDAREPCQFVFSDGHVRFGLLTDCGSSTTHIEKMLSGCDALMIECNHDAEMLANSNYPQVLKNRISGHQGHLSNDQAGKILDKLDCTKLQHIVAAHLSESNNDQAVVRGQLSDNLSCKESWIAIADQGTGLSWREIR